MEAYFSMTSVHIKIALFGSPAECEAGTAAKSLAVMVDPLAPSDLVRLSVPYRASTITYMKEIHV